MKRLSKTSNKNMNGDEVGAGVKSEYTSNHKRGGNFCGRYNIPNWQIYKCCIL